MRYRSESNAFNWLYSAVRLGDGVSAFRIGLLIELQKVAPPSGQQITAAGWFTLAANLLKQEVAEVAGCRSTQWLRVVEPQRQYCLAVMHMTSRGCPFDLAKAESLLIYAAKFDHIPAMHTLAWLCMEQQRPAMALRMLLRAAKLGNSRASFAVGNCYKSGRGVEQSMDRAAKWFEVAGLCRQAEMTQPGVIPESAGLGVNDFVL